MQKAAILIFALAISSIVNAQMALESSLIFGGNSVDEAKDFAVSPNGMFHFFGGRSFSSDGDLPGNNGGADFWITKRSSDGTTLWSNNYGGTTNDDLVAVMPHTDGGVLGFGTTRSSHGLFGTINGVAGGWLMRTNSNGDIIDGQVFGGSVTELAVDAERMTNGTMILALEAGSPTLDGQMNNGLLDAWIVNVSTTLQLNWSVLIGGAGSDIPVAIDVDINGNIYVVANSDSNLPGLDTNKGMLDLWIFKLAPDGELLWQTTVGGSGNDLAGDIRFHPDGGVYVIAHSDSDDGDFHTNYGLNDFWMIRVDENDGDIIQIEHFGGSGNDFTGRLNLFGADQLVVTGTTTSGDIDLTGNKGFTDCWVWITDLQCNLLRQMNYGGTLNDGSADIETIDEYIHVLATTTSMDLNVPPNGIAQTDLWYYTLNTEPDTCSGLYLCLADTTLSNVLFPPAEDVLICVNACNAGYGPGPQFNNTGSCLDFDNPTSYYRVVTDTTADLLTVSVTSNEFNKPYIGLLRSVNCMTYQQVECIVGENGEAIIAYIEVDPLEEYVIAVSDAEGNVGNYELCVSSIDVDFCNQLDRIYATSTSKGSPLNGPYQPGEEVQICYELIAWQKQECNGFQGLMPSFGPGWDPASFAPNGQPVQVDSALMPVSPQGFWAWYDLGDVHYNVGNPVNGYESGQGLPPGWYFTASDDPPPADEPDQTTGDIFTCLPSPDRWKICFTLTTVDFCEENIDCSVTMKTFADGEIGIEPNLACVYDQEEVFSPFLQCCLNPNIQIIQDFSRCSGDTIVLIPETNLIPPVSFFWTANADPFISGEGNGNGASAFYQILSNEAAIPLDVDYEIWAMGNGCVTDTESFTITLLPLPTSSLDLVGPSIVCSGSTVTLNFTNTGTPPFVIGLYRDNEPFIELLAESGFLSADVDPVFTSRLRIGELRDASCAGSGFGFEDVTIKPIASSVLDTFVCEGESIMVGDTMIFDAGMYEITLDNAAVNNCDSIVFMSLSVIPPVVEFISDTICGPDTIYILGQPYYETTLTTIEYVGPEGCPNFIQLNLLRDDTLTQTINQTICFGDTLDFEGVLVFQPGTYEHVEEIENSCYEQTILNLSVLPQIFVNDLEIVADNGTGTGAILCEILGGTPGFDYEWSSGQTSESIFNVMAGQYTLSVTDSRGCMETFNLKFPWSIAQTIRVTGSNYPSNRIR